MMADVHNEERRSRNTSRINNRDTNPEIGIKSILHKTAYRFQLHTPDLSVRPGSVLRKRWTVLFLNEWFWHRHEGRCFITTPACQAEFWREKCQVTIYRDTRNCYLLEEAGWKVATALQCDLMEFLERTLDQSEEQLRESY